MDRRLPSATDGRTTPDVLVVGEALVDVVHRGDGVVEEIPGGSPANVALTLGRLGRRPRLLTSLGPDPHGAAVRSWLAASDVRVCAAPAVRTSTATARLGIDGSATYDFSITWDLRTTALGEADVLHVGSIATTLDPGADAVSDLVDRHGGRALVTYDPNIRPGLVDDEAAVRARVGAFAARAQVVKASDEDVEWLHPGEGILDVARRWVRSGASLAVVTRGRGGALAVTSRSEIEVPAAPVDVVDTVGAGDTFMGALIDGMLAEGVSGPRARTVLEVLETPRLVALLHRAAQAAAVTVSRPGADPPTRSELDGGTRTSG
jgi:fructokinase